MEINTSKPKVLLTYIESGMGHITSMDAISDSLQSKYSDVFDFESSYIMHDYPEAKKFEDFMIKQVFSTNQLGGLGNLIFLAMNILGRQWFFRLFHVTFARKGASATIRAIRDRKPQVIVSTNHFTTLCGIRYKKYYDPNVVLVTYNPDNNVHVWWDAREGTFICNNLKAAKQAIRARGFKKAQVCTVPFVTRQKLIDCKLTKEEAREKYELPKDKFTVIIADGAYALARSSAFCEELVKTDRPLTILFIAGKNKEKFDKMTALKQKLKDEKHDNVTLNVYPFMPDIHELYLASDLFITKAGPNSIFDCVYMGTPVVVNYCAQPIEFKSYKLWIKDYGCGLGVFNKKRIIDTVNGFIDSPDKLQPYIDNLKPFCRAKTGAEDVADIIYAKYSENIKA